MSKIGESGQNRRRFIASAAGVLGAAAVPKLAFGQTTMTTEQSTEFVSPVTTVSRNNISSIRTLAWQDYFTSTRKGVILADLTSRALHFWSEDQSIYKLYPTSVPLSEDLTRRGHTTVTDKVINPVWRPTASMKERHPDWPDVVEGGSPDNPLGVRALYLGWPAYRIHGTHDTRKIGRRSSNGCVGLYNEHILELFELAQVGTQVLLI